MENRSIRVKAVTQHLRVIFRAVQAHSKYVEKKCGLSSAKLSMLYELHSNSGIQVSQLAIALAIHPSTCSNMLDKLEEQDYVNRQRSKTDQRAVHLSLTKKGSNLLNKAPQPAQGKLSVALQKLSDDNLQQLEESLEELIGALHEKDSDAALFPIPGE